MRAFLGERTLFKARLPRAPNPNEARVMRARTLRATTLAGHVSALPASAFDVKKGSRIILSVAGRDPRRQRK